MAVPAELVDRAKWLEGGIQRRAREHAWSYARWSKRKGVMLWASLAATAATGSSVTTALAGEPGLAWIAAGLAAVSAVIAGYERSADPSGTAERHGSAQTQLELLTSKYRHFIDYKARHMAPAEADQAFELLEAEREQVISRVIAVEPKARDAMKPHK